MIEKVIDVAMLKISEGQLVLIDLDEDIEDLHNTLDYLVLDLHAQDKIGAEHQEPEYTDSLNDTLHDETTKFLI
jgi:hypothetical protein